MVLSDVRVGVDVDILLLVHEVNAIGFDVEVDWQSSIVIIDGLS